MHELKGQRILITGGAGFIGSHVVDQLVAAECERIVVLDNMVRGRMSNLESALRSRRVDVVRGLALYDFRRAVYLFGPQAHHNRIVGNWIGTDATATATTQPPNVTTGEGAEGGFAPADDGTGASADDDASATSDEGSSTAAADDSGDDAGDDDGDTSNGDSDARDASEGDLEDMVSDMSD